MIKSRFSPRCSSLFGSDSEEEGLVVDELTVAEKEEEKRTSSFSSTNSTSFSSYPAAAYKEKTEAQVRET